MPILCYKQLCRIVAIYCSPLTSYGMQCQRDRRPGCLQMVRWGMAAAQLGVKFV